MRLEKLAPLRACSGAVLALLLSTRSARALPTLESELARGGAAVEAQAHFGVATAPFDVNGLSQAKGHAFVLLAGGRYALSDMLSLELVAPLVLASVAQPAGSYVDAAAFGNPQLGARYRLLRLEQAGSILSVAVRFQLGAPIAGHDADLMPNRALAIADGIEGRGRPGWFTPGVVPATASGNLCWTSMRWSFDARLELPVLLRTSRADLPRSASRTKALGLATVLELEGRYRLTQRLSLASALQLFFDLLPPQVHVADVSPIQDLERLSLLVHFGSGSAFVVDVQAAAGGSLGGSTVGGGLRLLVGF